MANKEKRQIVGNNREDAKRADPETTSPESDGGDVCEIHDMPVPPDGGWGWVIVVSSFFCNLIIEGIANSFGVFLPELVIYFNDDLGTMASMVGSVLAFGFLTNGPFAAFLTNKFGCRTTCIIGSVVGMAAFAISTLSNSIDMLKITYGIIGGIGFGLIYLPAIVSVSNYFEKKRGLATGIAVCGSGFGTFVFAPLEAMLLEAYGWKGAYFILAGIILHCAVFGSLMIPLEAPKKKCIPLLQRMTEDKDDQQLERGSLVGSQYFSVHLPDGTYERILKAPVNVAQSSFNLEELATANAHFPHAHGTTPPTISETKTADPSTTGAIGDAVQQENKEDKQIKSVQQKDNLEEYPKESDKLIDERKVTAVMRYSKTSVSNSEASNLKRRSGACGSQDDVNSLSASKKDLARSLAHKDGFYSSSVINSSELQSQKSLSSYRQSMVSIPKAVQTSKAAGDKGSGGCCTHLELKGTRKVISLIKDPVFHLIFVSHFFGILGFHGAFVFLVDAAVAKDINEEMASFLFVIIGITNTVGCLISGYISDFPAVNSLFLTNVCSAVSGVAVFCIPFCYDYIGFCVAAAFFGFFSSALFVLPSIILVDFLGIAQLTNAFGLLCLLRAGTAPSCFSLTGVVFDMTQSFDVQFWLAGIFLFISSAISFMVPCVRCHQKRKEQNLQNKSAGIFR